MTERLGDGLQNHLCQFDSDSTLHRSLVSMVARWTPNPKVRVQILYGLPKNVGKNLTFMSEFDTILIESEKWFLLH